MKHAAGRGVGQAGSGQRRGLKARPVFGSNGPTRSGRMKHIRTGDFRDEVVSKTTEWHGCTDRGVWNFKCRICWRWVAVESFSRQLFE